MRRAGGATCAVLLLAALLLGCGQADDRALVWQEDFEGEEGRFPDESVWTAELGAGGWGNDELQTYTDSARNVALDGEGHLAITARLEAGVSGQPGAEWTSARITTFGKRSVSFGRVEVRAKVPRGTGIWPAAWTLGQDIQEVGWPASGEIDLIESIGDATEALQSVHGPSEVQPSWYETVRTAVDSPLSEDFHVYSADWTPDRVEFAIDGVVTGSVDADRLPAGAVWPFTGPQYVLLNVAVGGRLPGYPDASTPSASTMLVDWVRVYEEREPPSTG